jgi:hypothetical protein
MHCAARFSVLAKHALRQLLTHVCVPIARAGRAGMREGGRRTVNVPADVGCDTARFPFPVFFLCFDPNLLLFF